MTQKMAIPTSNFSNPEDWLVTAIGGGESWSGVTVNEHTVLSSGPVYQAVNIISSTLAALPIDVKRQQPDGKRKEEPNHPASIIWNHQGNDEMIPYAVRQTLLAWGLIHGNGLGLIEIRGGVPVGVHPLPPGSVWLDRIQEPEDQPGFPTGQLIYGWIDSSGMAQVLFPWEVFHFKLMGNGLWGSSPLQLFGNTFGNGLGVQKYQGKVFANDARPSGVLQKDGKMRPEARQNLRREWNEMHQGIDNVAKVALLQDGVTWHPMGLTSEQAQMLESRKFYREEVASIFNLPPHMLGAMENSAVRANIEEQNRSFVRQTLIPHDITWGQESVWKLGSQRDRTSRTLSIQHDFKALLRGDIMTQANASAVNRQWGLTSANDERRERGMDEIGSQGDVYMVPANMADAETKEPFAATPEPPALPPPAEPEQSEELIAFARQKLHKIQAIETRNHRNNMHRKPGKFGENVVEYYSTFEAYVNEELAPLALMGFDRDAIAGAVSKYTTESQQSVEGLQDAKQLQDELCNWPERVEGLVSDLQKGDSDEKGLSDQSEI